jgi:ribosomal protein S18 acetylase RimI-like enzyme
MVNNRLADELDLGGCQATGLWQELELLGLFAWRLEFEDTAKSILLAVSYGCRRRGYGQRLKRELIDEARLAGARKIISFVDWDNEKMLRLNRRLGASIRRIPGDENYAECTLPV